jgi:hypothetical protein
MVVGRRFGIFGCAVVLILTAAFGGLASPHPTPGFSASPSAARESVTAGVSVANQPNGSSFARDVWQSFPVPAGFDVVRSVSEAADPVDHGVLVFGGCGPGSCDGGTNATWEVSNGAWTELHPPVSPPARYGGLMAWDPEDQYVLLFGGQGATALNDTWAFKNGTWNPVLPSGPSPPSTYAGSLAYDPSDHAMVLYGGFGCAPDCATWTYSGGTWTDLGDIPAPPGVSGAGFAEDPVDNGALLYGGNNVSGLPVYGTWLFSHDRWTEWNTTAPSPDIADPLATWDPGLNAVVVNGGREEWAFENGTWISSDEIIPQNFTSGSLTWDPTTGNLLQLSGCGNPACSSAAVWGFGPQYAVQLAVIGSACAHLTVGGNSVGAGSTVPLENGTYGLRVAACDGYLLGNVSTVAPLSLNVSVQNLTGWDGTMLVRGPGSISADFSHVASNPPPTGLDAISVLGLTFLELILVVVAAAAGVICFVVFSRRPGRPPASDETRARPPTSGF